MTVDPALAREVAGELRRTLSGERAIALHLDRPASLAVVYLRRGCYVIDFGPGGGWIVEEPPRAPPEGAIRLPAKVASVQALCDERVIVWRFKRIRGIRAVQELVLDFRPNRLNALWTEGERRIVRARLKTGGGSPRAGRPWEPPASTRKGAAADLSKTDWERLVEVDQSDGRRRALLQNAAYASSINAGHILEAPSSEERRDRWRRIAQGNGAAPMLLELPGGLQPYPWRVGKPVADGPAPRSFLDAMQRARETAGLARRLSGTEKALASAEKALGRARANLARQLKKAKRHPELRKEAELILAHLRLFDRRGAKALVPDYYGDGMRRIALPKSQTGRERAQDLFKRAGRLKRAEAELPERIKRVSRKLERVAQARAGLAQGTVGEGEARSLLASIGQTGARRRSQGAPKPAGRAHARSSESLPYRSYLSSGGLEVRVGRGARDNHRLTFHHARPNEIWLHARHLKGAHVVLRWDHPQRPPARDLKEAASLAALHSKGRSAGRVPVDWTRRKWVRRPKGAPPGAVVLDRSETVFGRPDPELKARLARRFEERGG